MRPVTALVFLLAPSCFPPPAYEYMQLEMHVRCSPGSDEIDLVLHERGIHQGSRGVTEAHEALAGAVTGRRVLPPEGGWVAIDFDEEENELTERLAGLPSSVIDADDATRDDRSLLELVRSARVACTNVYLDESGRISLIQAWTIGKPGLAVEWMNRRINENLVRQASHDESPRLDFPLLDEQSWQRAVARARQGGTWIRIEEGSFVLNLPITRECAAKCLAAVVEDEEVRKMWHYLLSAATHIEVDDEGTTLRLGSGLHGWIPMFKIDLGSEYRDDLAEVVKQSGLMQPTAPTLQDLARELDSLRASHSRRK